MSLAEWILAIIGALIFLIGIIGTVGMAYLRSNFPGGAETEDFYAPVAMIAFGALLILVAT